MAKSIIQDRKECFLCRKLADEMGYPGSLPDEGLHRHHIISGNGNRRLSEHYGLWVFLCQEHHEFGKEAVHANRKTREYLSGIAQRAFEKKYSHELWMNTFGKNWLEEEDEVF